MRPIPSDHCLFFQRTVICLERFSGGFGRKSALNYWQWLEFRTGNVLSGIVSHFYQNRIAFQRRAQTQQCVVKMPSTIGWKTADNPDLTKINRTESPARHNKLITRYLFISQTRSRQLLSPLLQGWLIAQLPFSSNAKMKNESSINDRHPPRSFVKLKILFFYFLR